MGQRWERFQVATEFVPVAAVFAFQTLAITTLTLVWERNFNGVSGWWLLPLSLLLLLGAAAAWWWKEKVRRTGTLVAVVAQRGGVAWETDPTLRSARRYFDSGRFLHYYPLVVEGELPSSAGDVVDWSEKCRAGRAMLHVVVDPTHGAPVDSSRLAVAVVAPLPYAFRLGVEWQQLVRRTSPAFELVHVRDVASPFVVWRSSPRPAQPIVPQTGSDLVVVLILQKTDFKREPFEVQFGDSSPVYLGRENFVLGPAHTPMVATCLEELHQLVLSTSGRVHLILATISEVAFAAGYVLAEESERIQLWALFEGSGYVRVDFGREGRGAS
ncbi:MAG: hypothetical protein KDB16_08175 [Acidimicrobiales bacterium]|nr:hypothetical protein [Acidimicrobiales bacterium]